MYDPGPPKTLLVHEEDMSLLDEKSLSGCEGPSRRCNGAARPSPAETLTSLAGGLVTRLRPSSLCPLVLRAGCFLLPSFLQARLSREGKLQQTRKPGPTAYLDGMRGVAALFVFFCHYSYTCFVIAEGWGYGEQNYYLLKLPFVRLFYQGPAMVSVFFVISGYALSLRPLKLARARAFDAFSTTVTSLVFRRAFRLFLPAILSTLFVVLLLRLGAYEGTRAFSHDGRYLRNVHERHPKRRATTTAQLHEWAWYMFDFVHVWDWRSFGGSTPLDVHLWTIPVEFRASMVLFLTQMGTARLRTCLRIAVLSVVTWFSYKSDRWEMVLFYAGMGIAELDLICGAHTPSPSPVAAPFATLAPGATDEPPRLRCLARTKASAWALLSIVALYFLSQPDAYGEKTPGWVFLSSLIPFWFTDKYRYWQSVGAALFVLSVGRCPGWQRVFNSAPIQYLGRISYAIYLMHGPVLHTLGYTVQKWAWDFTGTDGGRYGLGFALSAFVIVPAVIWAADLWWRAVDASVVRFAKWLEVACSVRDDE